MDLARKFQTRDADSVVEGLGEILAIQVDRAKKGMDWEDENQALDSEVTKVLKTVQDGGVQLAKLLDPTLAAPKIALQINQGHGSQATIAAANPRALGASVIRELEAKGIPRSLITKEMIAAHIAGEDVPVPEQIALPASSEDDEVTDAEIVE